MNETKFNGKGEIYPRFRTSYPQEFIEYLYSEIGVTEKSVVADVGSGTGILTKQLLEKGSRVYAVEPNSDMRKVAESKLTGFGNFVSVNRTAENTTLIPTTIDYVTVAQAFHWFNQENFKKECQRILKTKGKVILVWNNRDSESEVVKENVIINKKYCPTFKGFSGGNGDMINESVLSEFFDGPYITKVFDHPLYFDEQGFIGRNLSASYALSETDSNYRAYLSELKNLFEKYKNGDTLLMPNYARCYIGNV